MTNTLLIFIRNPQPGKVKTRLARTVGEAEALRIYRILLEKTRQAALAVEAQRMLYYSDFIEKNDEWAEPLFQKKQQAGADLGLRMERAFEEAFDSGAGKAVIIGSDCPELSGAILEAAFAALGDHDFVLGPAHDGGYYLLGMNRPEPALFRDVEWSTDTVLNRTLEKIRAAGCTFALLPVLTDVDTEADWRSLGVTYKTSTSRSL